jgi:predicted nucleic acid-binding protein
MLVSSSLGKTVAEGLLADSVEAHTSEINLAEVEYVLCRKLGHTTAKAKVDALRNSNYALIVDTEQASRLAAKIKCGRTLALPDCYTLATAELTGSKALFAFREVELERETKRQPLSVELVFLEDFLNRH